MEVADQKRATNWLALVISISSVIGIVLALLGYGVALAVQSKFGLPHSLTFSSTLELFNLGCWAVVQLLVSGFDTDILWSAMKKVWASAWPMTSVLVLIGMFAGLAWWLIAAMFKRVRPWLAQVVGAPGSSKGVIGFLSSHLGILKILLFLTGSAFVVVGTPIVLALGLVALAALCSFLAVIPTVGFILGEAHIDDWVVRPTACISVLNREALIERAAKPSPAAAPKTNGANCIAIIRGKEEIDRGRVIFATPNAVVLFDPRTGDVRRIPIDGATVRVIGEI